MHTHQIYKQVQHHMEEENSRVTKAYYIPQNPYHTRHLEKNQMCKGRVAALGLSDRKRLEKRWLVIQGKQRQAGDSSYIRCIILTQLLATRWERTTQYIVWAQDFDENRERTASLKQPFPEKALSMWLLKIIIFLSQMKEWASVDAE